MAFDQVTDMDMKYMMEALALARLSAKKDEVPVGAIIVKDGEIIGRSANMRECNGDATAHAEVEAIREACRRLGRWRLSDCEMYVTLEPCPMCAGAIVNARLKRVVFGTKDARGGAFGSIMDLRSYPLSHKPEIVYGVLEDECKEVLVEFFKDKR